MGTSVEDAGKRCTRCLVVLPLAAFGKQTASPDGLKRWCKPCATAHLKEWSAANPEKVAARKKRYYSNNAEKLRARSAEWRAKNPAKAQEIIDAWHARNPGKRRESAREWAKRNPLSGALASARRRAAKEQALPRWADSEFERLVIEEAFRLARLRSRLTKVRHHVDHEVPLQSALVCGLHCAANLRVIPAFENQSKNNRRWAQMP